MNFDELYKKIQDGTATAEEQQCFKNEMEKLRKISAILSEEPAQPIFEEASADTIKAAKKRYSRKSIIKIIITTLLSLLLIAAIVCGIIFIPSCTSAARNDNIGSEQAVELAKACVSEFMDTDADDLIVRHIDKELRINGRLNNAVYVYEIKFNSRDGAKYEVEVSCKSGYSRLTDIDYYDD